MSYEALYRVASEELDAAYESEGITWDYHAFIDGVTEYQRDMVIGRMVDAALKAMRDTAREYKDGLSGEGSAA